MNKLQPGCACCKPNVNWIDQAGGAEIRRIIVVNGQEVVTGVSRQGRLLSVDGEYGVNDYEPDNRARWINDLLADCGYVAPTNLSQDNGVFPMRFWLAGFLPAGLGAWDCYYGVLVENAADPYDLHLEMRKINSLTRVITSGLATLDIHVPGASTSNLTEQPRIIYQIEVAGPDRFYVPCGGDGLSGNADQGVGLGVLSSAGWTPMEVFNGAGNLLRTPISRITASGVSQGAYRVGFAFNADTSIEPLWVFNEVTPSRPFGIFTYDADWQFQCRAIPLEHPSGEIYYVVAGSAAWGYQGKWQQEFGSPWPARPFDVPPTTYGILNADGDTIVAAGNPDPSVGEVVAAAMCPITGTATILHAPGSGVSAKSASFWTPGQPELVTANPAYAAHWDDPAVFLPDQSFVSILEPGRGYVGP